MLELKSRFEELLKNIEGDTLTESAKKELRIEARELCFKLYQDNMENASWWKKMYQTLMERDKVVYPEVTAESRVGVEYINPPV